jgi:thiol-disulfide isomerase/thioredoxin
MNNKIIAILVGSFLLGFASVSRSADSMPVDISSHRGKVVLVDFWASWCTPCRKSFPWLNKMQQTRSSKGLVIIGVNVDEDLQEAKQFLQKNVADFNLVYDPKGQHASFYDIPGMPTTLIFDRQGKLRHQHSGFKMNKTKEYEQLIDQVLAM